ncbi:MAG TPA: hypothetical protein VFX42_04690 [Gemmatimonadales bacterium]|nr:hypothetical protein [Gemmatimonadales bacterium]
MAPRGRSQGVAALLLIVLPLLGCGTSPEKKAELAEQTARSWAATVGLALEAFASGAVSRVYAHQVLEAAREAEQKQSKQPEWNSLPLDARRELDSRIRELETAVEPQGSS